MAQLIKTRLKPAKWLLQNKLEFIPVNYLLASSTLDELKTQIANFSAVCTQSRNLIKDFHINKQQYFEIGTKRSIKRYKTQFVLQALLMAIKWRVASKHEISAMVTLAHKIAANITNSADLAPPLHGDLIDIEKTLAKAFSLYLCLPQHYCELINSDFSAILEFFGGQFLRAHQNDQGGQIGIDTGEMSFSLDFDEENITAILRKATQFLKQIDVSACKNTQSG